MINDEGVGTYTRQTFSNERYSIWTMQSDYHNLPKINGVSQKFGANYKATNVSFNPKKMAFSANIATAYPEKAAVKEWFRTYTLKNGTLQISDRFALTATNAPNQVNFLTWGQVDITTPGIVIIEVKGEKVRLSYDKNTFTISKDTIRLDDPRLSNVWGDEIYRLSLTAKNTSLTGIYNYNIKTQ